MGLYLGGLIIGRIFASAIFFFLGGGGACFRESFFWRSLLFYSIERGLMATGKVQTVVSATEPCRDTSLYMQRSLHARAQK